MKTQELLKRRAGASGRSPTLDTVLMIEATIYKCKGDKTVTEIWRLLPKKVMWTTYITALRYIEYSGKILIEKDRTITWIWNPGEIARLKKQGLVVK